MSSKISENGISILSQLPNEPGKKNLINTDVILQICATPKSEQSKNNIFSVSMMDMHQKYTGFLIKFQQGETPNVGDIIHIHSITIAFLNKDKTKIYVIKNYDIIEKNVPLVTSIDNFDNSKIKKNNIQDNENLNEKPLLDFKTKNGDFDDSRCMKLSNLTTFTRNIHLYVKCIKKSDIKKFTTKNGPGQLFNLIISDVDGFEMCCTAFNNVVDKLYNKINEGKIYEIKGGFVKINDKKFSSVKSEYRINFDDKTIIKEVPDNGSFRETLCNFVKINEINKLNPSSIIDIIGYVIEIGESKNINTKNGEQNLRHISMGDSSGYKIDITLWKPFSESNILSNEYIAFKNLKVNEFNNNKKLSTTEATSMIINPNYPNEIEEIQNYMNNNQNEFKELSYYSQEKNYDNYSPIELSYIKDIINDNISIEEQNKNSVKFRAVVENIHHNEKNYYAGCVDCKKKLIPQENNEGYICQFCNKKFLEPKYYYTLSCKVRDLTGETWIEMFGDTAGKFLNVPVQEYKEIIINNDQTKISEINDKIEFKEFIFIGKVRINTYNNVSKKRISVYRVDEINNKVESEKLIKLFSTLLI